MPKFEPGQPVKTAENKVEVTVDPASPLPIGLQTFELVVVDTSGNASAPARCQVVVRDRERPTAVIQGPKYVDYGKNFELSGERSSDTGGGQVKTYIWKLIDGGV